MSALQIARRADGSAVYTTVDGDMIDHVAWRYYGQEWTTTEAVYAANPGLAARGPVLPAGVAVVLPPLTLRVPSRQDSINLFD